MLLLSLTLTVTDTLDVTLTGTVGVTDTLTDDESLKDTLSGPDIKPLGRHSLRHTQTTWPSATGADVTDTLTDVLRHRLTMTDPFHVTLTDTISLNAIHMHTQTTHAIPSYAANDAKT